MWRRQERSKLLDGRWGGWFCRGNPMEAPSHWGRGVCGSGSDRPRNGARSEDRIRFLGRQAILNREPGFFLAARRRTVGPFGGSRRQRTSRSPFALLTSMPRHGCTFTAPGDHSQGRGEGHGLGQHPRTLWKTECMPRRAGAPSSAPVAHRQAGPCRLSLCRQGQCPLFEGRENSHCASRLSNGHVPRQFGRQRRKPIRESLTAEAGGRSSSRAAP
jgi:hypothetical protein